MIGSVAAAAQPPPLAPARVEAVIATARLYSVVRYFHPGDVNSRVPWDRFLVAATESALSVRNAGDIGSMLEETFSVFGTDVQLKRGEFGDSAAPYNRGRYWTEWRHMGIGIGQRTAQPVYRSWRLARDDPPAEAFGEGVARPAPGRWSVVSLAAGWNARVAVSMSSADALITRAQDERLARMHEELPAWDPKAAAVTRAQSLASGIAVWSIARHFYPYWPDVATDWDSAFRGWVATQPATQSRTALLASLKSLTARMDDGHAGVSDLQVQAQRRSPPLALRPLGESYVVTASGHPDIAPGDVIETIDSRPVAEVARAILQGTSAGAHSRPWLARNALLQGEGTASRLGLRRGASVREVVVSYPGGEAVREKRPEPIAELAPGIRYVDASRFNRAAFEKELPRLGAANAIVFDLRGYPTGDAYDLAGYWVGAKEEARWMHVPILARPFEAPVGSVDHGWNVKPKPGIEGVRKILMIDPRAISYSESLVGYFAAHAKGVIVGEPTAGANGNVSTVELPGMFAFRFTGMRVTAHDGKVFHARGFQPDVVVVPTVEGIAAGRDEVLERAVELARQPR